MVDRRTVTRAVLAAGVLAGILHGVSLPRLQPDQVGLATTVYHYGAATLLAGGNPYGGSPPGLSGYYYLYQPIVLGVMAGYGAIGQLGTFLVQSALNLVSTAVLALLVLRTIDRGGESVGRIDRTLIVVFVFLSVGSVTNFINGQVNPQLALGIAAGAVLLERQRDRLAGVVFGLVATVKLFPALLGVWLLRLRAWRTVVAAVGTGVSGVLLGVALLGPDLTVTYLTEALPREASGASFAGGPDPRAPQMSIRRQVAFLAPGLSSDLLFGVGLVVLAPVVAAASLGVETLRQRLVALQATVVAVLALFPFEPFYLSLALFPTVPLLYLLEGRPGWRAFVAGVLVVSLPITFSTVTVWVDRVPLPADAAVTMRETAETAFAFALPPTYGVWLLLAGCVVYQVTTWRAPERA